MFNKNYNNFVKPNCSPNNSSFVTRINGDEARKAYLEEIQDAKNPFVNVAMVQDDKVTTHRIREIKITDKELFIAVQNNDVQTVKDVLNYTPDKISLVDSYGWNLLMIACQANAIETVNELLKRGIDTSIRDKAGNSAHSLVIRNKYIQLASILLSHKRTEEISRKNRVTISKKEEYLCELCGYKVFQDRRQHLSSTIHNINASKGRNIPANYVIPESNKGFQLMVKVGWDKQSGLGRNGSGNKYPIKAVQKKDRKGLGHGKRKEEFAKPTIAMKHKQNTENDYQRNRRTEINFRREFY